MTRPHWTESMLTFLTAITRETVVPMVGVDECAEHGSDDYMATLTIVHMPGRWGLIARDEGGTPVIAMTDGTPKNTTSMWLHEDGKPFAQAMIDALTTWLAEEDTP